MVVYWGISLLCAGQMCHRFVEGYTLAAVDPMLGGSESQCPLVMVPGMVMRDYCGVRFRALKQCMR